MYLVVSRHEVMIKLAMPEPTSPTQNDGHVADDIFKRISLMKVFVFWFQFDRGLFLMLQLTISQH